MHAASPQPDPSSPPRSGKYHIDKLEAAGLRVIGAPILISTLVHHWHHLDWSAR